MIAKRLEQFPHSSCFIPASKTHGVICISTRGARGALARSLRKFWKSLLSAAQSVNWGEILLLPSKLFIIPWNLYRYFTAEIAYRVSRLLIRPSDAEKKRVAESWRQSTFCSFNSGTSSPFLSLSTALLAVEREGMSATRRQCHVLRRGTFRHWAVLPTGLQKLGAFLVF